MDFVTAWKACSIVLTGAFGILGLLTDFRHKDTKKITKWGRLSLSGILVSTVFGVAAQVRESHDAATQALRFAKQNNEALSQLRRLLTPIEDFTVVARFSVDCEISKMLKICSVINRWVPDVDGDTWEAWPGGAKGTVFGLECEFYDFDFDKATLLVDGIPKDAEPAFQFDVDSKSAAQGDIHVYNDKQSGPSIAIVGHITRRRGTDTVRGFSDLANTTVVVRGYGRYMQYLRLRELVLAPNHGYTMEVRGFKWLDYMSNEDRAVFEGKVP